MLESAGRYQYNDVLPTQNIKGIPHRDRLPVYGLFAI